MFVQRALIPPASSLQTQRVLVKGLRSAEWSLKRVTAPMPYRYLSNEWADEKEMLPSRAPLTYLCKSFGALLQISSFFCLISAPSCAIMSRGARGSVSGKSASPSVRTQRPDVPFEETVMTPVSAISSRYWRQPPNNF